MGRQADLVTQPVRLRDLIDQIIAVVEPAGSPEGLSFVSDLGLDLPEVVKADERRVRQILINVLGNAVKFTQTGQVSFKVRHAREMARIQIVDTGPGIPADELARISSHLSAVRLQQGGQQKRNGLGLDHQQNADGLDGRRNECVQSTRAALPSRSGCFCLSCVAVWPQPGAWGAGTGYAGQRQRVWVVDNEEADRGLLVRILEPLGFDVMTLSPVWRALDLCCDTGPCP